MAGSGDHSLPIATWASGSLLSATPALGLNVRLRAGAKLTARDRLLAAQTTLQLPTPRALTEEEEMRWHVVSGWRTPAAQA